MREKRLFPGELALILGLIFNSLATTLMVESGFGIASISSVPYTLSLVFDKVTFGVWNYSFQCVLIVLLVIITKKFKVGYIISFFMAIIFGYLIDFFNIFIPKLPNNLFLNTIYFMISFSILIVGIYFLLKCKLPILPIDTFTRDLPVHFKVPYKRIKTPFDLICLTTTVILSLVFLKCFKGIGIGTVICALSTGKIVYFMEGFLDEKIYFELVIFNKSKNEIEKA